MKLPGWKEFQADEYYSVPEKIRKKYMDKSIVELLDLLESHSIRDWVEEKKPYRSYVEDSISADFDYNEYKAIEFEILRRLELVKGYDMLQIMYDQFATLETQIDELETKFKDHRHKLGEGHYSEKPVW